MHLKEKFATQGVTFEAELKKDTVGLVTFDEFHQKRTDLEDKFAEQARLKQQQYATTRPGGGGGYWWSAADEGSGG